MATETITGVRWSMRSAAAEFGTSPDTLRTYLRKNSIDPDKEDDRYSTKQIVTALFGDLESEKVRLTRAQADKTEMENRVRSGELIEVTAAVELAQRFCFAARQAVMLSELPEAGKNRVLRELGRLGEVDFNGVEVAEEVKP